MIEVQIAKDEFHTITIRKSADEGDNTGLFGKYQLEKISIGDCEVTLKLQDCKIYAAYLTGEDGTISISCDEELGTDEILAIVDRIVEANS